jgi:hypothetical protein
MPGSDFRNFEKLRKKFYSKDLTGASEAAIVIN